MHEVGRWQVRRTGPAPLQWEVSLAHPSMCCSQSHTRRPAIITLKHWKHSLLQLPAHRALWKTWAATSATARASSSPAQA